MTTKMFGAPVHRKEDPRLLTGNGRYLDDLGHDALAAAFVRSPYAHARILDIDVTDALDVEWVIAIYTHEDLDGKVADRLPLLIPHPTLTNPMTGYCLAPELVNHVGEPVVMVVATDRYVAEDACERIRVDYEQLPVVVGLERPAPATCSCTRRPPATSPRTWCRRSVTPAPPSPAPRTRCPSPSRSSAARASRWRARASTPAGTATSSR